MRSARFGFSFLLLTLCVPVLAKSQMLPQPTPRGSPAQQTQSSTPPAPQDAQAIAVLNQVLAVAGGLPTIKAVADYTATGNITYHWDRGAQGSVTVEGLGLSDIRIDSNISGSVYSRSILDGQTSIKSPDGSVRRYPHTGPVPSSDAFPYRPPMFPGSLVLPYAPLVAILDNPRIAIAYKGLAQVDGRSVHDIQVQQVLRGRTRPDSMAEYRTLDFFIDPNTFQIVMTQDMVPQNIVHEIRYSNYTQASGIQIPFSVSETMGGQKTWEIQLTGATFNRGLQDSDFVLQ